MESLTRPFFHHRRKLSNVNSTSNGLSFSGKDAYDDVLLGGHPPKSKLGASSRTVVVEDYGEIFGTGRRGSSSIPVLDLSELDKANNGSYDSRPFNRKPDYSKIFGSFAAADDDLATSVPSYEELFGGGVKKAKARAAADVVSPVKESESFNSSENNRGFSSETSDQLLDGGKQMNMSYHKSSQPSKDGSNGTTHIAELHAVPGFTYFIDEATRPQKTEHDKLFRRVKSDANHSRSSSGDLSEGKSGRRAKWKLPEKQASEGLVNGKDNSWDPFSGKYNSGEFDLKSHSAEVSTPSSSSASLNDNQRHPKRAKSLTFGLKADFLEKDSNGYFSPSSDEELDVNSAAAASAAALKKAIQDAQERIRIAKELMERKRDPVQNTKSRANGSSKVKDRDEIKYDQDMNGIRKSNTKEACKSTKTEALGICGFDQKNAKASDEVASVFTCKENLSVDREVNGKKHEEGAEVNEEQGVGMWFTQLLNNGKNKMAALASQLVDNRNAIFQPTSKHVHDAEETTQAKESLEKGTTSTVDIHAKLDALGKVPDLEENLDKSISDKHVCDTGRVTLMNEPEEKSSKAEHGFHQQDKCEKKLVCEDATCNGHFEPEMLEDGCPANELRNIVEMKKEEEKSFEVETGKKLDDVLMWQDNKSRLDKKENWRTQEDSSQQIGNEYRPKEENSTESSEKEQENFQDRDFSRNSFEGDYHQEIDHKRSMCSIDSVESHNISEEEILSEHIDQRSTRTYQCESTDIMDAGADNRTESEKIEVNLEVEESDTTKGETYASNENTRNGLFPDAANEENLNARQSDESTILGGTPEVSELNNTSNQTGRSKVIDLEEHDNQTGIAGLENREEKGCVAFEQDTEEAEQEVKEATESKMFEASCSKHVLESITQDVSESLASDDNTENFGYGRSSNEEKLLMETSLLKTTSLTTKEPAAESINGDEAPTDEEKASHCDFVDMNGQKEIEKSDEESEISIRSENRDDLVHESECDAENIKEESIASDTDFEKYVFELHTEEKGSDEKQLEQECSQLPSQTKESEEHLETDTEMKAGQGVENHAENICKTSVKEEKENRGRMQKETRGKDLAKKPEVDQREREREKDRLAVERAIREARERAFAEARERAERAAVEKATAEVRQRAMAGAREKVEKVSAGTRLSTDKATTEAKLRAERAAVERATAEARERALEKALSQKSTSETRAQVEKVVGKAPVGSRDTGLKHSFSSSDLEGTLNESAQRRKARLERHQRIMERAAKALAEKNMRDILVQREQAERNRLAETLDADIKRWASGKEGNLRALLSTLQYILGPDSGWQSISLTEIITTNAVKKAYRKATLYVHPDKLQQRGATIQQKYTCEKVFDLLKAAWNRFISEER